MTTALEFSQGTASLAQFADWSPEDEEPNLEIYIRTRRTFDAKGLPCSRWEFAYVVEGVANGPLSQKQRDYAATAGRQIMRVLQDVNLHEYLELDSNLGRIAISLRAEMKALMNMYVRLAEHLVRDKGLMGAAAMLGLKAYKVRHLLHSRGRMPSQEELA